MGDTEVREVLAHRYAGLASPDDEYLNRFGYRFVSSHAVSLVRQFGSVRTGVAFGDDRLGPGLTMSGRYSYCDSSEESRGGVGNLIDGGLKRLLIHTGRGTHPRDLSHILKSRSSNQLVGDVIKIRRAQRLNTSAHVVIVIRRLMRVGEELGACEGNLHAEPDQYTAGDSICPRLHSWSL